MTDFWKLLSQAKASLFKGNAVPMARLTAQYHYDRHALEHISRAVDEVEQSLPSHNTAGDFRIQDILD